MASVAVVLIARNQAFNVARLIESVLRETRDLPGTEVVFVDSASDDGTPELASRYPITVLRLDADQPLTAAAGRYVGFHESSAELVLFLDGDMELARGWLPAALEVFARQRDVAVVTGDVVDLPKDHRGQGPAPPAPVATGPPGHDVPYSAGAAMHRRRVLDRAGTFNPHLHSDEEPELCIRIRHAGHRIVALDTVMAYHYSAPEAALSTLIARWRRGLYLGAGEAIRHNLRSGALWPYVRERGYGFIPGLVILGGLASATRRLAVPDSRALKVWSTLIVSVLAGDLWRRRDPRATAHSLLERMLILDGTVRGFLRAPALPAEHPARFERLASNRPPGTAATESSIVS
jgi:glycosyltransferase involved in cell wall biosynthesis